MFEEFRKNVGSISIGGYKTVVFNDHYHSPNDVRRVIKEMVVGLSGHSRWERRGIFILPNSYDEHTPFAVSAGLREESEYSDINSFLQSSGFIKTESVNLMGATKNIDSRLFPDSYSLTNDDVSVLVPKITGAYEANFLYPHDREPEEPFNLVVATSFQPKRDYQEASIWTKYVE